MQGAHFSRTKAHQHLEVEEVCFNTINSRRASTEAKKTKKVRKARGVKRMVK